MHSAGSVSNDLLLTADSQGCSILVLSDLPEAMNTVDQSVALGGWRFSGLPPVYVIGPLWSIQMATHQMLSPSRLILGPLLFRTQSTAPWGKYLKAWDLSLQST